MTHLASVEKIQKCLVVPRIALSKTRWCGPNLSPQTTIANTGFPKNLMSFLREQKVLSHSAISFAYQSTNRLANFFSLPALKMQI